MNLLKIYEEVELVDEGIFSDAAQAIKNKVQDAKNRVATGNTNLNEPDKGLNNSSLKTKIQNFTNTGVANEKKKPLETAINLATQIVQSLNELKNTDEPTRQTNLRNSITNMCNQYQRAYNQIFKYLYKFPTLQDKYGPFSSYNYEFAKKFLIAKFDLKTKDSGLSSEEKVLENLKMFKQDIQNVVKGISPQKEPEQPQQKKQSNRKTTLLQSFNQMSVDLGGKYTPDEIKKVYLMLFGNTLKEETLDMELSREAYLTKALQWFLNKYVDSKEKILSADKSMLREIFWEKYSVSSDISDLRQKMIVQKALKITDDQLQNQPLQSQNSNQKQSEEDDTDPIKVQQKILDMMERIDSKGGKLVQEMNRVFTNHTEEFLDWCIKNNKLMPTNLLQRIAKLVETGDENKPIQKSIDSAIVKASKSAKSKTEASTMFMQAQTEVKNHIRNFIKGPKGSYMIYRAIHDYVDEETNKGTAIPEYLYNRFCDWLESSPDQE